ncbi:hypothetical protein N9367_03160 [Gammaproteobacteria bacterium]|nr:hypothetical protein [Gammaproteobacteria bacterium]
MKKLLALLLLFGIVGCEKGLDSSGKTPICKDTIKGKFGYFDNCQTIKYQGSGYSYTGTWKNNKFHGTGSYTVGDVTYHVLEFNMGKMNGDVSVFGTSWVSLQTYKDGKLIKSTPPTSLVASDYGSSSYNSSISIDVPSINYPKFNSGGSTRKKTIYPASPSYAESYSYTQTVPSNRNCPLENIPLRKQEVRNGNRICYY